jgi:hypothetical protein
VILGAQVTETTATKVLDRTVAYANVRVDGITIVEKNIVEFNEQDLAAAGKIQEKRGCTIAKAKEIYRKHVLKLANQDADNRAELVLDAIERGVEAGNGDEAAEAEANGKAKKQRTPKAPKEKKERAPKKASAKKPSKSANPRIEHPLAKLEREVELTPLPETHLYTGILFGKKSVIVWVERNRSNGADTRYQSVNVSESQLDEGKKYAKAEDMPFAVCCTVRVMGKLDQGYAIPVDVFNKEKAGEFGFNLSGAARKSYAENGWDGVKFSVKKVEEKAA